MTVTFITTGVDTFRSKEEIANIKKLFIEGTDKIRKAHDEDEFAGWGYEYRNIREDNALYYLRTSLGMVW